MSARNPTQHHPQPACCPAKEPLTGSVQVAGGGQQGIPPRGQSHPSPVPALPLPRRGHPRPPVPALTGSMEVVGHEVDEIQGLSQGGQVQACSVARAARVAGGAGSAQVSWRRTQARARLLAFPNSSPLLLALLFYDHRPRRRQALSLAPLTCVAVGPCASCQGQQVVLACLGCRCLVLLQHRGERPTARGSCH